MATIFQKIIDREIPAEILHEDDICIAIKDIEPQAPLSCSDYSEETNSKNRKRRRIGSINSRSPFANKNIALKQDLEEGFRVVINNGPNGGENGPIFMYIFWGRKLSWPPG